MWNYHKIVMVSLLFLSFFLNPNGTCRKKLNWSYIFTWEFTCLTTSSHPCNLQVFNIKSKSKEASFWLSVMGKFWKHHFKHKNELLIASLQRLQHIVAETVSLAYVCNKKWLGFEIQI